MNKITLKTLLISITLVFLCSNTSANSPQYLMTKKIQESMTPLEALNKLKQGNIRFVTNQLRRYSFDEISKLSSNGQFPFGIILSCVDSRSAPDYTFDQGLGNIFIARTAGNVVGKDVLGSMEFATKLAGAKLIVVMGHTYCGAVTGACKNVKLGNLSYLLEKIKPAVKSIKANNERSFSCDDYSVIDKIAKQNVLNQMKFILAHSPIINELVKQNKVFLVGAMHDLTTRKVKFFDINGNSLAPGWNPQ